MKEWKGSGAGRGLLLGVALTAVAATLIAAGRPAMQVYHVTSTAEGRVVHLWSTNGADLRYLASAEVPRSKIDPRGQRTGQPAQRESEPEVAPAEKPGSKDGKPGGG